MKRGYTSGLSDRFPLCASNQCGHTFLFLCGNLAINLCFPTHRPTLKAAGSNCWSTGRQGALGVTVSKGTSKGVPSAAKLAGWEAEWQGMDWKPDRVEPVSAPTSPSSLCPGFHIEESRGALGRECNEPLQVPATVLTCPGTHSPSPAMATLTTASTYLGGAYSKCRLSCHGWQDIRNGPVWHEIRLGKDGAQQVLRRADGRWWLHAERAPAPCSPAQPSAPTAIWHFIISVSQQTQIKTANQCCCVSSVPKQLAEVKMG